VDITALGGPNDQSAAGLRVRPLIIVERDELQLYVYLRDDYAGQGVDVILDRREPANRRRADVPPREERRRRERRRHDISRALAKYGWVFVRRPPPNAM